MTYHTREITTDKVYLVQNLRNGQVKIGHSTNVRKRVMALEASSGAPLELLRTLDGGRKIEQWMHKRFSQYRGIGEWFAYHHDMLTITPPDSVPVIEKKVIRRDVRLTAREQTKKAKEFGCSTGLSNQDILFMIAHKLTNEDAAKVLSYLETEL